jgi:prevent-host-death family protein
MKTIQASEAKAQFLRILDDVERGESIAITRHGREIAVISPSPTRHTGLGREAFASIRALRQQIRPMSVDEILSARNEGRR